MSGMDSTNATTHGEEGSGSHIQASPLSPAQDQSSRPDIDPSILPASHWQHIQAEYSDDDDDSAHGSISSGSTSLAPSIYKFREMHGRTYHSDFGNAESWEPNDENHLNAMDSFHHLFMLVLKGKLFLAPIKDDVKKVIDIGTGTGIWANEFGDLYPGAEVVGTDITPIQTPWVPPNVRFELEDANQAEWSWPDNTFDFVHARELIGSIKDWPAFYREAYRICKPGGYFEHFDNSCNIFADDGTVPDDSPISQYGKVMWEGGKKFGQTFRIYEDDVQKKGMEAAGFVDIVTRDYKVPFTPWPADPDLQEQGAWAKLATMGDIHGYIVYVWNSLLGWKLEEIEVFIAHFRRQVNSPKCHPFFMIRVAYGRKPEH